MKSKIRKAIFPVGGLGTRFLPATKALPKEMLPVVDKPLIQYAVEEAREAGIEQFIFVTGRGKTAIEDHFDRSYELEETLLKRGKTQLLEEATASLLPPGEVVYIRQQEPSGLGHAVWCARHLIEDEPVAVLLADDLIQADTPCLKQMIEAYPEVGGNMLAVMDVPYEMVERYGVLDVKSDKGTLVEAKGMVEKPKSQLAPSNICVIGRYILQPSVFQKLDLAEKGSGGEIQLTDAIAKTLPATALYGYRFKGTRFDCGDKTGFLEANLAFALARSDLGKGMAEILRRYR